MYYFDGLNEFKKLIHDSKIDLQQLIEDTKIQMEVKKNPKRILKYNTNLTIKPKVQRNILYTIPFCEHDQQVTCRQKPHNSIILYIGGTKNGFEILE